MDNSNGEDCVDMDKEATNALKLTEASVYDGLTMVMHPEIESHNLVELGMIQEVSVKQDCVNVKLALPFREVPIKEELITTVRTAVNEIAHEVEVEVDVTEMNEDQRASFMAVAKSQQSHIKSRHEVATIIAVMSGKGGVGKSSVAGLLASALKRRGLQVGILDADITGPSIPKIFGVRKTPVVGQEGIIPVESGTGIKLMSINLLLPQEDQPVVWRGPLIGRTIEQFWNDIAWGRLDYLIVDLPPGTSDAALTVMQSLPLDGIVLVTSPQDLAGMVVRKAANMAKHLRIPLVGLMENMSHVVCPQCGAVIEVFGPSQTEENAHLIGTHLLGRIPLTPELAVLCDRGEIETYLSNEFEVLTEKVIGVITSKEDLSPVSTTSQPKG
jgi:Mrp family chromosome partitioning ATPase